MIIRDAKTADTAFELSFRLRADLSAKSGGRIITEYSGNN
jgi:hypothetical protein